MARYITLAATLVSVALAYPDAPLYPNNVVFASLPFLQQTAQPSPQFITRTINNGAYSLQPAQSPTLFVAAQPNQINNTPQTRVVNSPAAAAPQGVLQVVSAEGAPTQSVPRNFVTFTRTPSLQLAESAAPQQSAPRNFVAFTRTPAQQVQSSSEPVQSAPRNFVTFTRNPPQQFVQLPSQQQNFGSRTIAGAAQPNEQPQFLIRTPAQQQIGLRNVFVPASSEDATSDTNRPTVPAQRSGIRTVIVFPPQQANTQSNLQTDQRARAVNPQPTKQRTVLVARPAQGAEQSQPSGNLQNQPSVSSSQFFTRNFGGSGAVTYFIQPLSAPAGQAPSPPAE